MNDYLLFVPSKNGQETLLGIKGDSSVYDGRLDAFEAAADIIGVSFVLCQEGEGVESLTVFENGTQKAVVTIDGAMPTVGLVFFAGDLAPCPDQMRAIHDARFALVSFGGDFGKESRIKDHLF